MPLTTHLDSGPEGATLRVSGEITETAELVQLAERVGSKVTVDLSGITRINSTGLREWIRFLQAAKAHAQVVLERCAPAMVRQFSMVADSRRGATVASIQLPYFCEHCDEEQTLFLDLLKGGSTSVAEQTPCPACSRPMTFDEVATSYLAFLQP